MSDLEGVIPLAPIFRPTAAEFADFRRYVYGLSRRKEVIAAGCAKVVSPPGFSFRRKSLDTLIRDVEIPRPLEQQVQVGRGFFDLKLVQRRAMPVGEYKRLVDKDNKLTKGKSTAEVERYVC